MSIEATQQTLICPTTIQIGAKRTVVFRFDATGIKFTEQISQGNNAPPVERPITAEVVVVEPTPTGGIPAASLDRQPAPAENSEASRLVASGIGVITEVVTPTSVSKAANQPAGNVAGASAATSVAHPFGPSIPVSAADAGTRVSANAVKRAAEAATERLLTVGIGHYNPTAARDWSSDEVTNPAFALRGAAGVARAGGERSVAVPSVSSIAASSAVAERASGEGDSGVAGYSVDESRLGSDEQPAASGRANGSDGDAAASIAVVPAHTAGNTVTGDAVALVSGTRVVRPTIDLGALGVQGAHAEQVLPSIVHAAFSATPGGFASGARGTDLVHHIDPPTPSHDGTGHDSQKREGQGGSSSSDEESPSEEYA